MPYKEHLLINTPSDNTILWKYLDLAKFLSLITTSHLHFTRIDTFEDPYEGSYSNPKILEELIQAEPNPELREILRHYFGSQRKDAALHKNFYVSCWHANYYESAAMWKLYSMNEYGIAIKSSVKRLKESLIDLDIDVEIGKVAYIDYDTKSIPTGNTFYPIVHKRLSFEFEHEVRAIIWLPPFEEKSEKLYYSSPIDLLELIEIVYVSPTAPDWIVTIMKDICIKYALDIPVVKSDLMKLTY